MNLVHTPGVAKAERIDPTERPDDPKLGRWFWVVGCEKGSNTYNEGSKRLGCVTHIGSNYVELTGPGKYGEWVVRVHTKDFLTDCTLESNAEAYVNARIAEHQGNVRQLMGEIEEVTRRLSVGSPALPEPSPDSTAIVLHSATQDPKRYKKALIKAKDKELPALFKQIEEENKIAGRWMSASLIPVEAQVATLKPLIKTIEDRIFNVELYAGLCEEVEHIRDGKPALRIDEPIHLYQRRAYMDEECLAEYKTGGMEFKNLKQFDKWIAETANFERLLPHPRTIVAFQVRREEKEREHASFADFIRFMFGGGAQSDKFTFLYMRNGEQLYRLSTEIEFGEKLFPDQDARKLETGQLYAHRNDRSKLITQHAYDEMKERAARAQVEAKAKYEQEKAEYEKAKPAYEKAKAEYDKAMDAWYKENKGKGFFHKSPKPECPKELELHEPCESYVRDESEYYEPWDQDNVHYDDITDAVHAKINEHNRLVLVLQGILDRSPTMHPHPPWKLHTVDGFNAALRLVYDYSRALVPGPAPDFEAYRAALNAKLHVGSITVGQDDYWTRIEGKKESARRLRWARSYNPYDVVKHWRPYGNPGPGSLARVAAITRKACTFKWTRERLHEPSRWSRQSSWNNRISCQVTVPRNLLLNVDAYKPGDFKQFFADPRTRAKYLKWTPLLLEAEEYHAGNREMA